MSLRGKVQPWLMDRIPCNMVYDDNYDHDHSNNKQNDSLIKPRLLELIMWYDKEPSFTQCSKYL
jgi:hypothetical protein